MPATLRDILLAPDTRPHVIDDCFTVIELELAEKSGISGNAVKLAYRTASSFAPGYLRATVESMLPDIVDSLQPYWADFTASGGAEFGDYLGKRSDEVAESLLSVTDAMAAHSERPVIVKAYRAVRGSATTHVQGALPRVGDLVLKYAG